MKGKQFQFQFSHSFSEHALSFRFAKFYSYSNFEIFDQPGCLLKEIRAVKQMMHPYGANNLCIEMRVALGLVAMQLTYFPGSSIHTWLNF